MTTNYVRLPLKNAYNARDLGGYACAGKCATLFRAFVRSDGLERLDGDDARFLNDYGIRTIIDLRSSDELANAPDPAELKAFADYVNIPLIPGNAADITKLTQIPPEGFLASFYVKTLESGQDALCAIMSAMADARSGCILFHCSAGKDRTGIIAALLLGLAGVSRADILSNYEVTYTYIRDNPIMQKNEYAVPKDYFYSLRENLEPSLEYIHGFGTVADYLMKAGLSEAAVGKIRCKLVES